MMAQSSETKSGRFTLAGKLFSLRLAALLLLAFLACAATATPIPESPTTPTLEPTATPAPKPTAMPAIEAGQAEIGVRYAHKLYTHCGIRYADFDGRKWLADPILGSSNPPPGWGNPSDPGTMELITNDRALFLSHSGEPAFFIPAPVDYQFKLCA
jgi:hypothetical protein